MSRGIFIAIEGIPGSGKSTQVAIMAKAMNNMGAETIAVAYPGTTPAGKAIREILLDQDVPLSSQEQLLLLTAARASLAAECERWLSQGINVVSESWVLSTYVYMELAGQTTPADTSIAAEIDQLHQKYCDRLDPDIYVILDMPHRIAMERLEEGPSYAAIERLAGEDSDRDDKPDNEKTIAALRKIGREVREGYTEKAIKLGIYIVDADQQPFKVASDIGDICVQHKRWPCDGKVNEPSNVVS